jgi:hypothetical protein
MAGTGELSHRTRHQSDGAGTSNQYILSKAIERKGGVDCVSKGIKDGRNVVVYTRFVVPNVRHWQGNELRKSPLPIHADT